MNDQRSPYTLFMLTLLLIHTQETKSTTGYHRSDSCILASCRSDVQFPGTRAFYISASKSKRQRLIPTSYQCKQQSAWLQGTKISSYKGCRSFCPLRKIHCAIKALNPVDACAMVAAVPPTPPVHSRLHFSLGIKIILVRSFSTVEHEDGR